MPRDPFSIKWLSNDSWIEGNGTPMGGSNNNTIPGAVTFSGATAYANYLSGSDESLGTFSFPGGSGGDNTWNLSLASSFKADATVGDLLSLLMSPTAGSSAAYVSNSRNFQGASSNFPLLMVSASATPVPEPGTVLYGAACVALAVWVRSRRRAHAGRNGLP